MSQENVEIVRRLQARYDGTDLVPRIRELVERLGPNPEPEALVAWWSEDPGWRYMHPEIDWDPGPGLLGRARGITELSQWWAAWVEAWESYVFRVSEYRDLGEWVLTVIDVRARGRGDIPVEMRVFELYRVRDGKVAMFRSYLSEHAALEAAGPSEQDPHADC
jgi:ketosteroid isomerase-like protein